MGSPGRVTIAGGYNSEAASRRIGRESSRISFDGELVRKSIDRARQRLTKRSNSDRDANSSASSTPATPPPDDVAPNIAYLIVSPLLSPVSALITMFTKPSFERQGPGNHVLYKDKSPKEEKFLNHPTCLIYGGKDVFTSSKKIKRWADELHSRATSSFSAYQVENAGHFWTEPGAPNKLQSSVEEWLSVLLSSTGYQPRMTYERGTGGLLKQI